MENDISEVAALLHVHEKAIAHGSAMSNIAAAAYDRLTQINGKWGEQLAKEKAARAEEEASKTVEPMPEPPRDPVVDAHDPSKAVEAPVEEPLADIRRDLGATNVQ